MTRVLPLVALLLAGVASAEGPVDVLAVVVAGSDLPEDLDEDVGEPLAFALGKETERRFAFLPLDEARAALGYQGATSPGSCVFDSECLRKKRKELQVQRFLVVRLAPVAGGQEVELTVTRISDASISDVTRSQRVNLRASEIINAARGLVLAVLVEKRATLMLSVNEPGATIEVGDVKLAPGETSLEVVPGVYTVKVSKADYVAFETSITCRAGEQCAVSASIFPVRGVDPLPFVDDTGSTALIISGWSVAGVGAALGAVGIFYGLKGQRIQGDLEDACATPVCDISSRDAALQKDEGKDASRIALGTGITGAILFAGGLATAIAGHLLAPDAEGSVEISPAWLPGGGGLFTTVRF